MTTIKLGLSGDMHVNVPKRSEEAWRIAYWMLEDWKARGVHLIGIAGDLADGPLTEKERAQIIEYGDACSQVAPLVVIDGNHEISLALRNALGGRRGKYPIIVEDGAAVHVVETDAGPIAVACVSFPKKAKLLAACGHPMSGEEVDAITGKALQDIFRGLGVRVRELGLPTVALVHGAIKGSKIADDQPDRPLGMDIDLHDLALVGADFYDVAHVHKVQHWTVNNVTVATPSCPFFADWGEAAHEKGYILAEFRVDRDTAPAMQGDLLTEREGPAYTHVTWSRVSTPAVPMILLESKWLDGEFPAQNWPDIVGADLRFRYEVAADQRKAAGVEAAAIAGTFRLAGAVNVKIEEIVTPTTRSRIPGLSKATTLWEKLLMYWESIDFQPDERRKVALKEAFEELQDEAAAAGFSMATAGRAAPALKRFRGKGLFKFKGEFDIDFTKLGELVTIVAPNEEGKSLILQTMSAGLLYGKTPTRGSLDDLSTAKDTFIEGTFDMNGAEYVLTQNCNRMSRTGSVSLLKNGEPELSKAGRAEYKEWAAKYLLPSSVYDAVICQSGTKSVIDLDEGPRVELLIRVLGLEADEVLAESGRRRAKNVTDELAKVRASVSALEGGNAPEVYQEEILRLEADLRTATEELRLGEVTLADLRSKNDKARSDKAEVDSLTLRIADLQERENNLDARIEEAKVRLMAQQELMREKDAVDEAVLKLQLLTNEMESLRKAGDVLASEHNTSLSLLGNLQQQQFELTRRCEEAEGTVQRLTARQGEIRLRIAEHQDTIVNAASIKAAIEITAKLKTSLQTKADEASALKTRAAELAGALAEVRARINGNAQHSSLLVRKKAELATVIESKINVMGAVEQVLVFERELATAVTERIQWALVVEHLQTEIATSKDTRITGLYGAHNDIANGLSEPVARSMKAMSDDGDLEAEAEQNPVALTTAKQELLNCDTAIAEFRAALIPLRVTASRLPEILAAEESLGELSAEIEASDALHAVLLEESNNIIRQEDELKTEAEVNTTEISRLNKDIGDYLSLALKAEALTTAEAQSAALTEQHTHVESEVAEVSATLGQLRSEAATLAGRVDAQLTQVGLAAEAYVANACVERVFDSQAEELFLLTAKAPALTEARVIINSLEANIGDWSDEREQILADRCDLSDKLPDVAPIILDLGEYEDAVATARSRAQAYQNSLSVAETNKKAADDMAVKREGFVSLVKGLEAQIANWTLLGLHLGQDHLQKAEISDAGPQLTAITNDLLRTAGDTRHTVSIETEKLHSNKKRMIPTLDINVWDAEEGQTKESRRLSDAGKIIVGWPFGLAVIVMACERAGIKGPTIFIDEAAGPLDPVNAPRCASVLRHFAQRLESQVVFVAQQPEIQALADNRLCIKDGQIFAE